MTDIRFMLARDEERAARQRLAKGCAQDIASLDELLSGPLAAARRELSDLLAGLGAFERTTTQALVYRATDEIAARCIECVADNVNMRFRARFRMYVDAVAQSESRLLGKPRRPAVPRIDLRAVSTPLPSAMWSQQIVDDWIERLRCGIHEVVQHEVEIAQRIIARRVIASVARSRATVFLRRSK